jgi:predicted signal transduction protein with EAL and GGDEF domain
MTRDPAMPAIVKTIIALGESLDITVTAEGVESQEQASILREYGARKPRVSSTELPARLKLPIPAAR